MQKIILKIGGMSCSACSSGLEKYFRKQQGVVSANVNLVLQQAVIEYEDFLTVKDLERFVTEAGFDSLGVFEEKKEFENHGPNGKLCILFGILAFCVFYIAMAPMFSLPEFFLWNREQYPIRYAILLFVLTLPFLFYGKDIFQSGIKNFIHKTPNMDTLVSLGVAASFSYSIYQMILLLGGDQMSVHSLYLESCCMIIFFVKLGRYIDSKNQEKTKEALKELVQITPNTALLKVGEKEKEVTIDEVQKNDILIAKPGMKIAVDGKIVSGSTHLEEAFITGESTPIKKQENDKVIAGSMNIDGYITYQAEKIGKDSTISEIVRLVVEASSTKAPIQKIADQVSGYFVPGVLFLAIITFLFSLFFGSSMQESLLSFVSILVVACPCALGLATPLAIVVSEGLCAKNGILVKSSETLEKATKIDTIVFDKTGTLTYGNLRISKIYHQKSYRLEEFLKIGMSLEAKSTHPISKAFLQEKEKRHIALEEVTNFQNLEGIGLTGTINKETYWLGNAKLFSQFKLKNPYEKEEKMLTEQGNSIIYIMTKKEVLGLIGVTDMVREEAKTCIQKLKQMKKEIIMLTGDNENTAKRIAREVGIEKVISNVLPQEKTKQIQKLLANHQHVMMVGDGINDAPSLASSDIGVSFHSGTDIAADSADIILIHDRLEKIPAFLKISQKTFHIIKENLFWAFFYNSCMIPVAMGLFKPFSIQLNPMLASFAMMFSSLTVVLNSLRIKNWKEK